MTQFRYEAIADDLRKRIISGDLKPLDRLPSETDLEETWEVSRATVRRALLKLETEGLIVSHHRRGWAVKQVEHMIYRPQGDVTPMPNGEDGLVEAWAGQISASGRLPTQIIEVAIVTPPQLVATRLGLKEGEVAVLRKRTRSINGVPSDLNDSYYPLSLAKDARMLSPNDVPEGIMHVLAEQGHRQCHVINEIDVTMPSPEQQSRLRIGPAVPVAKLVVTAFDQDRLPIRCTVTVLPGDRHRLVYEYSYGEKGLSNASREPRGPECGHRRAARQTAVVA